MRKISIVVMLLIIISMPFINKVIPSFKHKPLKDYYQKNIVFEGDYVDYSAVMKDNDIYLPVDFVGKYIDKYIFWEPKSNRLTITTENKVIKMETQNLDYFINNKPMKLNVPVYNFDDVAYLPISFMNGMYHITAEKDDSTGLIIIQSEERSHVIGKTRRAAVLRYEDNIKSPIAAKLSKDEKLYVYGDLNGTFAKVRTSTGLIGYTKSKNIIDGQTIPGKITQSKSVKINHVGKIRMLWDQLTNATANYKAMQKTFPEGVNVISPTWFSFDTEKLNGDIINLADMRYVEWAHGNDCEVWALISDNFSYKVNHAIISDADNRENAIRQLLVLSSMYHLDGINIDFETVNKDDAKYYLQFLRELKPLLSEQNVLLSVDMYVPTKWSMYYNRTEVGKVVDYVCIMAYDEHNKSSKESGPVASISFVDSGIRNTLKEVPSDKTILGLPFYVRVWRETNDNKFTVTNYSMDKAREIFDSHDVKFKWLNDIESYYGEYEAVENNEKVVYKTWLEDEKSIEEKLKLAKQYNLKGISGWKRGLENENIWPLINSYIK